MENKKLFCFILGFILILLIANVSALGVTPGRSTINFEPGTSKTISFSILNSEERNTELGISVQGDLKQYIQLSQTSIAMSSLEKSRELSYTLNFPEKLSPGVHTAEIVISQKSGNLESSEAYVEATLAVITQVQVYVPYPGKYAAAFMNIIGADNNGEVTFVIPVSSMGEFDLVKVKANIEIYNSVGEKITSFYSDEISVPSRQKKEIVSKWKANAPVGSYRAVATLMYDGETLNLEAQFNIGSQSIELQSVEINDFSLGQVAKVEMLVENKWSEKISGAYAQTQIFNEKGELLSDFKSPNYDLSPLAKTVMTSYWDSAGMKEGTYSTKVFLKYSDKSDLKNLQFKVSQDSVEVIGLGYVISGSKSSSGSGSSLVTILIIAVVVLALINVLWFIFLRKRLKR